MKNNESATVDVQQHKKFENGNAEVIEKTLRLLELSVEIETEEMMLMLRLLGWSFFVLR